MKGKFFLDTNILVYSFDHTAPAKRKTAESLINKALCNRTGIISYQVLQEFINVAFKKLTPTFSSSEMHMYTDRVLDPLCELFPDIHLYHSAVDIKDRFQFSFYDSLIISAAVQGNCDTLYSEDLQAQQEIFGLVIKNPF